MYPSLRQGHLGLDCAGDRVTIAAPHSNHLLE